MHQISVNRLPALTLLVLALSAASGMAAEAIDKSIAAAIDAGFTELERQLIGDYFGLEVVGTEDSEAGDSAHGKNKKDKHGKKDKGLPPGLAKRGELPPGLAKRAQLPPGLAKRSLPDDLEHELPPVPEGYERRIIEDAAVVLIHTATGEVVDIIKDVFIPGRQ